MTLGLLIINVPGAVQNAHFTFLTTSLQFRNRGAWGWIPWNRGRCGRPVSVFCYCPAPRALHRLRNKVHAGLCSPGAGPEVEMRGQHPGRIRFRLPTSMLRGTQSDFGGCEVRRICAPMEGDARGRRPERACRWTGSSLPEIGPRRLSRAAEEPSWPRAVYRPRRNREGFGLRKCYPAGSEIRPELPTSRRATGNSRREGGTRSPHAIRSPPCRPLPGRRHS